MSRTVIIFGSSRKNGATGTVANHLRQLLNCDLIDLNDYEIGYYDYTHRNKQDGYLPLIKDIIDQYEVLIFATPVYWYAMSGIMKVFIDRLTDLLEMEKEWGRKMRGKSMAVLSSSTGDNLGVDFWLPFKEIANYMGMIYLGNIHMVEGQQQKVELAEFAHKISRSKL